MAGKALRNAYADCRSVSGLARLVLLFVGIVGLSHCGGLSDSSVGGGDKEDAGVLSEDAVVEDAAQGGRALARLDESACEGRVGACPVGGCGARVHVRPESGHDWQDATDGFVAEAKLADRSFHFGMNGRVVELLRFESTDGSETQLERGAAGPPLEFVEGAVYAVETAGESEARKLTVSDLGGVVYESVTLTRIPERLNVAAPTDLWVPLVPVGTCPGHTLSVDDGCTCAEPVLMESPITPDMPAYRFREGDTYASGCAEGLEAGHFRLLLARSGDGCQRLSYEVGRWVCRLEDFDYESRTRGGPESATAPAGAVPSQTHCPNCEEPNCGGWWPVVDWGALRYAENEPAKLVSARATTDDYGGGWQMFVFDSTASGQPAAPTPTWKRRTIGGLLETTPGDVFGMDTWIDGDERRGAVVRKQGQLCYIAVAESEMLGSEGYVREFTGAPAVEVRGHAISDEIVAVEPPAATTCKGYRPSRLSVTIGFETFDLGEGEYAVTDEWVVGALTARTPVPGGCVPAGSSVAYEIARRRW